MSRMYMLSNKAYNHLTELFARPLSIHNAHRYKLSYEMTATGNISTHREARSSEQDRKHEIGHPLSVVAAQYQTQGPTSFIDSRPEHIIRMHNEQITPTLLHNKPPTAIATTDPAIHVTIQEYREWVAKYPLPTYEATWYEEVDTDYLRDIEDDERLFDELQEWERVDRLALVEYEHKYRSITLSKVATQFYKNIAMYYNMAPLWHNRRHSGGSLVASALEAIGIGWLTPPPGYYEYILATPNPNHITQFTNLTNNKRNYRHPANSNLTMSYHVAMKRTSTLTEPLDPQSVFGAPGTKYLDKHPEETHHQTATQLSPSSKLPTPMERYPLPPPVQPPTPDQTVFTHDDLKWFKATDNDEMAKKAQIYLDGIIKTRHVTRNDTSTTTIQAPPLPPLPPLPTKTNPYTTIQPRPINPSLAPPPTQSAARKAQIQAYTSLSQDQIVEAYQSWQAGIPLKRLAMEYNTSQSTIHRLLNRYQFSLTEKE